MINARKNIVVGNPNNPTSTTTYIHSEGTTTSVAAGNQGIGKDNMLITNPNSEGEGDMWAEQAEQPIDGIVANPNSEGRDDDNNDDGIVDNSIATNNNNDDESSWSLLRSRPTKKPTRLRTPRRTSAPTTPLTHFYDDDDDDAVSTLTTVTPSVIENLQPSTPSPTPCESRKWYLQVIHNDGMTEGSVTTTCTNGYDITTSSKYDTFLKCCEGEAMKTMDYTDCKYVDVCNNPMVPKPALAAIIDDDISPPTLFPSYLATAATTSSTIMIVNAMSSKVNNDANSNLNWYDSLKEKVGTTSNGFMIVLVASSAILVITIIVALIIDRKRQKTRQQEHDLLQNQSSPTKGIVASMIDQVLGQSMLLPMGDISVTSSDDDVGVSSYNNGSVQSTEIHVDVYAPPGKLGLILDDSPGGGGGAMIYTCKEGSALQSKVQYGDVIIAVNDKDVQHMTAIQVSKLLAKKSGHRLRKISIVRYDIA
jgi:hypothetical protein